MKLLTLCFLLAATTLLTLPSAEATSYYTVLRCEGLRMEVSSNRYEGRQLVINNVYDSFKNLGNMLNNRGNPSFVRKWNADELVVSERQVHWNSLFATMGSYDYRLLTVDLEGNRARVRVYEAAMLNMDDGYVNPSSIKLLGDHVFNNCVSL